MNRGKKTRLLISGYYGFNNIGDESILKAVVDNLKSRLPETEITVLSQDPDSTAEKYRVRAADRKSPAAILKAVQDCDILISGGGSLLQDVTSKRSILYYLAILRAARAMGKKTLIYSQGIGPINGALNRKLTAGILRKADGIVVRDEASREFLGEIGVPTENVLVTADPVLRLRPADRETGAEILRKEGFIRDPEKITAGFAIRERKLDSRFLDELCVALEKLTDRFPVQAVLIPFHYSEDRKVIEELERRLGDRVFGIRHKYLTEEMLSIIGNMDVLTGVRLHALIHAAIMDVPMIAVSYDPKVNSFMSSVGMRAMGSVYDFDSDYFLEEFERTLKNREEITERVRIRRDALTRTLDANEEMIRKLMTRPPKGRLRESGRGGE